MSHNSASSEEGSLTGHSLAPPRPFFLDTASASTETGSDSDRDAPLPSSVRKTPRSRRRRSQLAVGADGRADEQSWTPSSLYETPGQQRPPPSAYTYPFQAHPGNPDPWPESIPRRGSVDSIRMVSRSTTTTVRSSRINNLGDAAGAEGLPLPHPPFLSNSPVTNAPYRSSAGSTSTSTLYRSSAAAGIADAGPPSIPRASSATTITFRSPFLSPASRPSSTWSPPSVSNTLPFNVPSNANSMTALPLPPVQKKTMLSTRLREKLRVEDKPWLALKKSKLERASKWVTFAFVLAGVAVAALIVFRGYQSVHLLRSDQLCIVLDDNFSGGSLDTTNNWSLDVELGGFGNGEFEMTTNSPNNLYIHNGQLYIMPTLTSDSIPGGYSSVMDGATYTLDGCTAISGVTDQGAFELPHSQKRQNTGGTGNGAGPTTTSGNTTVTGNGNGYGGGTNSTTPSNSTAPSNSTSSTSSGANACSAVSSAQAGTVINPAMSGRINTRGKKSIKYGKVEVRAKLPQGDWLWPAVWMLPEGNSTTQGTGVYGAWPVSGEMDIMEARGNLPSYPAQGSNYVRSSLNFAPYPSGASIVAIDSNGIMTSLLESFYGWVSTKRGNYASDFHVYALEWTDTWVRFYTDNRLKAMINLDIASKTTDSYFFHKGSFPTVAMNMSSGKYIEVQDPWSTAFGGTAAAPFDQQFYLVIDLAVGGTSGWFPDGIGNKPWYDSSATAMREFAAAQSTWSATWPSSADRRAFRIDYVKMWQLC